MSDTSKDPVEPSKVLLKISFDVDQETDQLHFTLREIKLPTDIPDPNPSRGGHADSLFFVTGDEMHLHIIGGGKRNKAEGTGFQSFQIVDCAIITRPQVSLRYPGMQTQWSPPSPFTRCAGASYQLPIDFAPRVVDDEEDYLAISQHWKPTLNVGFSHGMWELSFTMTVRISRGGGQIDQIRVLMFDPEAEVGGTGTIKFHED